MLAAAAAAAAGERGGGPAARHLPVGDRLQQEPPRHSGRRQAAQHVRRTRRHGDQPADRRRPAVHRQVPRLLRQADGVPQTLRGPVRHGAERRESRGTCTTHTHTHWPSVK